MSVSAKLNVTVVFKGTEASDAVKDYAEKRAGKFTKHLHAVTDCNFVFHHGKTGYTAHLNVTSGDFEAHAEGSQGENLYAAIDEVTEKVLQQTRKFKEKATNHAGIPHHNDVTMSGVETESADSTED